MKLSTILLISSASATQWFPLTRKEEIPIDFNPYTIGDEVPIDCTSRKIDNGEHKFDENDRIIYVPFPKCEETGKPLSLKYGVSEDINCTIGFSDELYHLFQLYIHEDAPFSCRVPFSKEKNYLEKGGASVPLTFNFRGEIHDSHLDIDQSMNLLVTKPQNTRPEENTIVSAVAFGSGTNATRIVIGDKLTINLAVRWYDQIPASNTHNWNNLPYADGFYKFPMAFVPISKGIFYLWIIGIAVLSAVSSNVLTYKWANKKKGYVPLDVESQKLD